MAITALKREINISTTEEREGGYITTPRNSFGA